MTTWLYSSACPVCGQTFGNHAVSLRTAPMHRRLIPGNPTPQHCPGSGHPTVDIPTRQNAETDAARWIRQRLGF